MRKEGLRRRAGCEDIGIVAASGLVFICSTRLLRTIHHWADIPRIRHDGKLRPRAGFALVFWAFLALADGLRDAQGRRAVWMTGAR